LAQGDSTSPDFIEQESEPEAEIKKGKKFPWLLIGAVVVVGAAAVYFLVIKKPKYTLTVNLGAGATGTPAATAKYKKGEAVAYNYTPQSGYFNLQVKLDGVAVAASGSVNMDKDHTLEVTAVQGYTLTVNLGAGTSGTPPATAIYPQGHVVNYTYSAQAGYAGLQVSLDGAAVASSGIVTMNTNHTLDVTAVQGYTLTVNLGTGTTGTPAITTSYAVGQVVNYSYSTQAGYGGLQVKLDDAAVAASGSVTMNSNHTLATSAVLGATVNINSTPTGAAIFDNYVYTNKSTNTTLTYTTAGTHTYLLRKCGYQDYSKTQNVVVGQIYNINAILLPGIFDDFLISPTCWVPRANGNWTVASGLYQCKAKVTNWNYSNYNSPATTSTYTVEVKMARVGGSRFNSTSIVLGNSTDMTRQSGYLFNYTTDGWYSLWRWNNRNLETGGGTEDSIKDWNKASSIIQNLGSWNIIKIVRSGSAYSFYINGVHVFSFSDSHYDPRYLVLTSYFGNEVTEIHYEYAKLTQGAAMGLMPVATINSVTLAGEISSRHK
jgi:hypothetical protein